MLSRNAPSELCSLVLVTKARSPWLVMGSCWGESVGGLEVFNRTYIHIHPAIYFETEKFLWTFNRPGEYYAWVPRGSRSERAWKSPHAREGTFSRVGWFSRTHAFRSLYYPWGKMVTTRSLAWTQLQHICKTRTRLNNYCFFLCFSCSFLWQKGFPWVSANQNTSQYRPK